MLLEPLFTHARQQPQHLAVIDDRGRYTYAAVGGDGRRAWGCTCRSRRTKPRVGILLPAGVGVRRQFLRNAAGWQDRGADQLPAGRPGDRPHHPRQRHRHHPHRPAAVGPAGAARTGPPLKVIDLTPLPPPPPAAGDHAGLAQRRAASDLAVLMYTSGTSGLPKGVLLTYGNLQSDVEAAIEHAQLQGKHKFLGILPLFHSTGMLATMLAPMHLGSTVVYMARFSPVGDDQRDPRAQDLHRRGRAEHVRRDGPAEERRAGGREEPVRRHQRRRAAAGGRPRGVQAEVRHPDLRRIRPDRNDRPDRLQRPRRNPPRLRRPARPRRRGPASPTTTATPCRRARPARSGSRAR